jgi:hypothetical protein
MDSLPIARFLALGFFCGFLCYGFLSHWFRLLLMSLGNHPPKAIAPDARARRGATVFLSLHPVTWLIVLGLPWGLYRLTVNPPSLRWLLFIAVALFGLLLPALIGVIAVKRMLAKKRAGVVNPDANQSRP